MRVCLRLNRILGEFVRESNGWFCLLLFVRIANVKIINIYLDFFVGCFDCDGSARMVGRFVELYIIFLMRACEATRHFVLFRGQLRKC